MLELLAAHDQTGSFFVDKQPVWQGATQDPEVTERVGEQIGPYTLREQIGEGGMGVVYVAEQEKPIRRKVALKVIKPGMDSKAVLARFEAERNALALMNNQARLVLFALAYNLANILRRLALPKSIRQWSLTTLREKLAKIVAKVNRHSKYVTFQLAEVAVP